MKRTAIFIDGENVSYQLRAIGRNIDWKARAPRSTSREADRRQR